MDGKVGSADPSGYGGMAMRRAFSRTLRATIASSMAKMNILLVCGCKVGHITLKVTAVADMTLGLG